MKFQIRKGENSGDGTDMFYVYQWEQTLSRWVYIGGYGTEEPCRALIKRINNPKPEIVIAEIGE